MMQHSANRHERRRTESALRLSIKRMEPHLERFHKATDSDEGKFVVATLTFVAIGVATGEIPRTKLDEGIDAISRDFNVSEKAVLAFVAFQIAFAEHAVSLHQTTSGEAADRGGQREANIVDEAMRIVRERRS